MYELVFAGFFLVLVTLLISILVIYLKIGDEFLKAREMQHLQLMATFRLLQKADLDASGHFYDSDEMKVYMLNHIDARRRRIWASMITNDCEAMGAVLNKLVVLLNRLYP